VRDRAARAAVMERDHVKTPANESRPSLQQQAVRKPPSKIIKDTMDSLAVIGGLGFILSGTWLLIFLVSCLFVRPHVPSFGLDATAITVTSAPGKPAAFNLAGMSAEGKWASDNGLTLQLQGPNGYSKTFIVTRKNPADWGKELQCGSQCTTDQFAVRARFTLPSYPDGTKLTGTLTGDVLYPVDVGNGYFENSQSQLSIPVTLTVKKGAVIRINGGVYLFDVNPVIVWAFFGSTVFLAGLCGAYMEKHK